MDHVIKHEQTDKVNFTWVTHKHKLDLRDRQQLHDMTRILRYWEKKNVKSIHPYTYFTKVLH